MGMDKEMETSGTLSLNKLNYSFVKGFYFSVKFFIDKIPPLLSGYEEKQ